MVLILTLLVLLISITNSNNTRVGTPSRFAVGTWAKPDPFGGSRREKGIIGKKSVRGLGKLTLPSYTTYSKVAQLVHASIPPTVLSVFVCVPGYPGMLTGRGNSTNGISSTGP